MKHARLELKDDDGTETVVYLERRPPLDGHGGKLRQIFTVLNRHYEEIGSITRYRNDSGWVTHWTATTPGFKTTEHQTRAAAIHHLLH